MRAAACVFYRTEKARLWPVVRRNHSGIQSESQWHVGEVCLPGQFEMTVSHHLHLHLVLVQQMVLVAIA